MAKILHDGRKFYRFKKVPYIRSSSRRPPINSFLWKVKNWKPTLPSATPGDFTMVDLLRFVDDINPLGDV